MRPAIAQSGPIKTGMGCAAHRWGGGGRGSKRALRHHVRRQRGDEVRHAGPRHRHADASSPMVTAETLGLPISAVKAGNRRHDAIRSAAARAAARRPRRRDAGDPRDRGQGARRAVREGRRRRSASTPETLVASKRPHPRQGHAVEGHGLEGRLQADRHRADLGRRRSGTTVSPATGTSGVQFTEATSTSKPASSGSRASSTVQDCGLIVDKLLAESQVYGGIIGVAQLRAVRGSHPRSQSPARWSTRTWSGICWPGCPTCRRSTSC